MARKRKITIEGNNVYVNGNLIRNRDDYNAVEDAYSSISDYMIDGNIKSTSHLGNMICKVMKSIDKGEFMGSESAIDSVFRLTELAQNTQDYFDGKKADDADYGRYLLRKKLFPWQREAFDSTSKRKLFICSRRTGKSHEEASEMVAHCLKEPETIRIGDETVRKPHGAMYVGMTIQKAANIMWDAILKAIETCKTKPSHIDNSSYTIEWPNGNFLQLAGNSTKAEREKIRGAEFDLAIIDEMQSQTGLQYLMDSILLPIIEPRRGTVIISGTGPLARGGYWDEAIQNVQGTWEIYHKSIYDNLTIQNPDEILEGVLVKNGWDKTNITFRREWLAETAWDENLLIYPKLTFYDEIPSDFKPVYAYIGLDLGWRDNSAFATILFDENDNGYCISEWKKPGCDVTTLYNQALAMVEECKTVWHIGENNIHIVADTNEKNVNGEFYNRGLTCIEDAYKTDLKYRTALLNEALANGRLKVKKGGFIEDEASRDVYKYDSEHQQIIYEEDKNVYHADIMFALMYSYNNFMTWRNCGA